MTSEELQVWQPDAFEKGTDLLPVSGMQSFGPADVPVEADEDLDSDDIVLPTLSVLQGTSEPVKQQVEGAVPGKLWLSASQEVVEQPARFLVVSRFRGNVLFARKSDPRHEGLETCISRDGVTGSKYGTCETCKKCTEWGEDGSKPLGTKTQQFVVWLEGHGICMLRIQLSNKQVGKAIRTYMTKRETSNRNYFAHPTVLRITTASDEENTWFVPNLFWQGAIRVPDEMQRACSKWAVRIKAALELGNLSDAEDGEAPPAGKAPTAPKGTEDLAGDIPF